ncbi:MAG: substrate-binding domain-containing protein, partial [Rhabdochlamydiaceae bacterium]
VLHVSLVDVTDPHDLRIKAMRVAAKEAHVPLSQKQCVDGSQPGVRSTLRNLIQTEGAPDAIIADTDSAAIACIRALHDCGKSVPQDCIVVGFGGTEESEVALPSLTTVSFSASEAVGKAWRLLESKRVQGLRSPISEVIEPNLIVRESSLRNRKA